MTDREVQLFLADLAVIILLAQLFGHAARRLGQPPVLGEIIAGILLGPTLFDGQITETLFPDTIRPALSALANLGVVMFMFAVGYLLDLRLIRGRGHVAVSVSVSSILLPLSLGVVLGAWLADRHQVDDVLPFALFVGTALSVTAFPVLARILTDRDMHRTRIGSIALASAATDDALAWTLLAVVAAIAGAGGQELRLLLAPVYVVAMFVLVRPLLRTVLEVYPRRGRITPTLLAAVLVGLLLSSYATDWMGLKYIFGAFLFGVVMPREGAAALREDILRSLEPVSVLVLLPVFFVVAGLSVDLSSIGVSGLGELSLILLVAVVGKLGGAFAGARLAGVDVRRSGALATLMNTRGLTGIVILATGLQLHILDESLYTLMIVMAVVTTMMAGPLLQLIYPDRYVQRDLVEVDRAELESGAAHRILVLVETPETAAALVDVGTALAISREHSQLVLAHLVPHQHQTRSGIGTGLGGELLQLTTGTEALRALADRAVARGVAVVLQAGFSADAPAELLAQVAAAQPDTLVVGPGGGPGAVAAEGTIQLVTVLRPMPEAPGAVGVAGTPGEDGAAAVQVAVQLAVANGLRLVIGPGGSSAALVARLTREGVAASDGPPPADAVVVTAAADTTGDAHVAVLAGTREGSDDLDRWVRELDRTRLLGQG